ncbi:MAG: sulfatase family protein [Opitutales bacterium]
MESRPNILWITFEDTSPRYGCYGDPAARTPHVDRIAREGCLYTRAFSTAGVCAPARSAIITGQYASSMGAHHMRTSHTNPHAPEVPTPYEAVPAPWVRLLPERFRCAGYYCTNNEKTDYQFKPPFTAYDDWSNRADWRGRADGQPFFAIFNLNDSHESGFWLPEDKPVPDEGPYEPTDPGAVTLPPYLPDTPEARAALARHYDCIHLMDRKLGRLLTRLEEDGELENTIIVVWSDHGSGMPRGKRWPYDAGIHVPLVVRAPGVVEPGTTSDRLVSTLDLPATMLSLAGMPVPPTFHSRPFLGEQAVAEREHIFAHRDRHDVTYDKVRAVRDRRFKYIRNDFPDMPLINWQPYRDISPVMRSLWQWRIDHPDTKGTAIDLLFQPVRPPEELYDTENDPWEIHNLAENPDYRETRDALRTALAAWECAYDPYGDWSEEQLVAFFQPGGEQPVTATPLWVPQNGKDRHEPTEGTLELAGPLILQLAVATHGASIGWRRSTDPAGVWRPYHRDIRIEAGETVTLEARAQRIGYQPSTVRTLTVRA